MGAPDNQKPKPSLRLDLALLVAVAAFSAYSGRAFFRARAATTAAPAPARALASLPVPAAPEERSTKIMEIACGQKPWPPTGASLLQLRILPCKGALPLAGRNETTGEPLLLFRSGEKALSHYFPLKEGMNRIRIEGDGYHQLIEVEREPLDR